MAPTITGARDTANIAQGLRKVDMAERILLLQPSANPLTVFVKNLSKKPTVNPFFQWAEDDIDPRFDTANGAQTSGSTTLVVNNGSYWAPNYAIYNTRTAELMYITAVSTNTLTVVRGVGSTAAAINNGDELLLAGVAKQEGDVSDPAKSGNPSLKSNYTQIFRRPVELTETWRHSDQFVQDDDEQYTKAKEGIEHARDIEYAFKFGHPALDTSGAHPRRFTGGAFHFIATNQTAVGGTMTEAAFFAALRPAFRYGGVGASGMKEKLGLFAPLTVDVVNAYARGKIQVTDQGRTTYGVKVVDYVSPHGVLHAVTDWSFADSTKYNGTILILDLEQIKYRYLANSKGSRDSAYLPQRQAPDADTQKGEYLSECGLSFGLEQTHARLDGITG